ncbi:MAG: DUF1365 domain-containing protein [Pseudomonadota bacterium]
MNTLHPTRDASPLTSCLYRGTVMHKRLQPFSHSFSYRVFSVFLDLSELSGLGKRSLLFSHNRWNILSFWDRDHGARDGTPLRPWIDRQLKDASIELAGGSVRLFCFPRLFGFAFNPLSIWFCYRADESLAAILYEVRNTFGQKHGYLIPMDANNEETSPSGIHHAHSCHKRFYVSPFLPMEGRYNFRILEPAEKFALLIRQTGQDGNLLLARQQARRHPFSSREIVKALIANPLMTLKVISAIHWQALHLWRRGARFHTRPEPPPESVTTNHTQPVNRPLKADSLKDLPARST